MLYLCKKLVAIAISIDHINTIFGNQYKLNTITSCNS